MVNTRKSEEAAKRKTFVKDVIKPSMQIKLKSLHVDDDVEKDRIIAMCHEATGIGCNCI